LMSSFLPLQALIATLASPVNGSGLMVVSQQHTRWILALVLPLGESLHSRVLCYLGEKNTWLTPIRWMHLLSMCR
jgi:hypothetical protein